MAQTCVYLVMVHNIPQELVVNIDQIGIHIVPKGGIRTWETKGFQNVKVHGIYKISAKLLWQYLQLLMANVYHSK
jgi:hypothetical protein